MRYDGISDQLIVSSLDKGVKLAVEKSTIKGFDIQMYNSDKIFHYKKLNIKDIFSGEL